MPDEPCHFPTSVNPTTPAALSPAPTTSAASVAPNTAVDPNALTPEEQMARFEQSLKESDWGHQPC